MILPNENIFLGQLPSDAKPKMALFLSGAGSNAEKLLSTPEVMESVTPKVLVTDAPEKSRAREIGRLYNLPVVELSIRDFYRQHGLNTISLATPEGRSVRELWTGKLRDQLQKYSIDLGILAGFEPLSNITDDFICLNVHPGDLTKVDADGNRMYIGLHSKPIEKAILAGETALRSSVIIAKSFANASQDMDNGLLLGISPPMPLDLQGFSLEKLQNIYQQRQGNKPMQGWQDALEKIAHQAQEQLKFSGDHFILPLVVRDIARRRFAYHQNTLYYRADSSGEFYPVRNLEYQINGLRKI